MSDIRDFFKKNPTSPPDGEPEKQWGAEVRPEPPPLVEPSDEVAVPSGRTHNRMVQTLFVYPPGEAKGLLFQYCDMTSPGEIAVDGSFLMLRFRGVGGIWRVAIEGARLDYLAGRVGEHKQGVIKVTKPDEWADRQKLVREAVVENIIVTKPDDEHGPSWREDD